MKDKNLPDDNNSQTLDELKEEINQVFYLDLVKMQVVLSLIIKMINVLIPLIIIYILLIQIISMLR